MVLPSILSFSKQLIQQAVHPGDTALDATVGNGHDTLFLAEKVGSSGRVYAFDIQPEAIHNARRRLESARLQERVTLFTESHHRMAELLPEDVQGRIRGAMFNLGYLPGDDHQFTTQTTETIAALSAAAHALKPGGILSVVCYPGHEAGAQEAREVEAWITVLTSEGWRVAKYGMLGTLLPAPFLIIGRKE